MPNRVYIAGDVFIWLFLIHMVIHCKDIGILSIFFGIQLFSMRSIAPSPTLRALMFCPI